MQVVTHEMFLFHWEMMKFFVNQDAGKCITVNKNQLYMPFTDYRVIALVLVNIVPRWDIEGPRLASVLRFPNEGQYSPISV